MKKENLFSFVAVLLVLFSITSVNADTIPGLFNTGVDNNGNLSNIGSYDLHYTVNGQRPFIVTADPAWNDPLGSPSIWVSISSNTWASKGEYTYIINSSFAPLKRRRTS